MMSYPNLLARIFLILISPWFPCCDCPIRQSNSFLTIPKLTAQTTCEIALHQNIQVYSRPTSLPVLHCCFRVPDTGPLPWRPLVYVITSSVITAHPKWSVERKFISFTENIYCNIPHTLGICAERSIAPSAAQAADREMLAVTGRQGAILPWMSPQAWVNINLSW